MGCPKLPETPCNGPANGLSLKTRRLHPLPTTAGQTRTGPNQGVTHRHIAGHFGPFFQVEAVFRPVTHPHINSVFRIQTGTSP